MSKAQKVFDVRLNESDCTVIFEALSLLAAFGCDRPKVLNRLGLMFAELAPPAKP